MTTEMTTPANEPMILAPGTASPLPLVGAADYATQEMFDQLVRSSFMPRISLCGGMSGLVIEGKMHVGKYAFIRGQDDFVDFGDTFNCVPFAYRLAAAKFIPGELEMYYDPLSDDFKRIVIESEEPNSKRAYGPQFLIWVPQMKEFATFLFGSKSARPEGRKLNALINKGATFKAKLVSNTENKWHVPVVLPCSIGLELPSAEQLLSVGEDFKHPKATEILKDADSAKAGASDPNAASTSGRQR